jgi:hypothetical protein
VYVTLPAEYVRPPEKVVDATHVGVPPDMASTCPPVPFEIAETLPVVPRRSPESDAMRSWFETYWLVEVAEVEVEFVKTPVDGVVAPIGVFSIVPPEMVRLFATCASVAEPIRSVKLMPSDDVASCWYVPPAYEPRRMPAAVGELIPVPPPPAVKRPASVFANVHVSVAQVMVVDAVSPLNAVDEVARRSEPVSCEPVTPSAVTPLLIDEVATQVGVPPDIARTKPLVPAAIEESVSAVVVYKRVLVPPKVETPVPPEATPSGLPRVTLPFVSMASAARVEVAEVAADEVAM